MCNLFDLQGTTTYFSANCDKRDAEIAQEFMVSMVTITVLVYCSSHLFGNTSEDCGLYREKVCGLKRQKVCAQGITYSLQVCDLTLR